MTEDHRRPESAPGGGGSRGLRTAWIAIFAVSLVLRLALALVNREANDDHLQVVATLLRTGHLPTVLDCWECFQPKLFHATMAMVIRTLGIEARQAWTVAAQLTNFVAGLMALGLIGRVLRRLHGSESLRLLAFALVAFNPKLIGISAQATNDAFVILFSTLSLYGLIEFFERHDRWRFLLAGLAAVLAISSKANGWVIFLAILSALLCRAFLDSARRRDVVADAAAWMVLVPVMVMLNPLSQALVNYQRSGSPAALNIARPDLPGFMDRTDVGRPGVRSIQDGLLTFRFADLIRHPRIENGFSRYPAHRTSLWTQIYGRAHSVSFDNWPPSWGTTDGHLFPRLRALFVLALLPTALVLLGGLIQARSALRHLYSRDLAGAQTSHFGHLPFALWGSIAFVAAYATVYREFPVMKAIFIYPAIMAFPVAFVIGAARLPRWATASLFAVSTPLLGLYVADVISLILRLAT